MARNNSSILHANAKELRKQMTKEECHLWFDYLMTYRPKFRKQTIIGHYIVDFYCAQAKLAVELDGSQHYEEDGKEYDRKRSKELEELGVMVIRFQNNEVMQVFEGVCERIDQYVKKRIAELKDESW